MKAMLLAAGEGRRLRPLTADRPKPLLEVAGKALIVYHLEALRAAGIKQVVINVSYLGEQIVDALGDGARWGLQIAYSQEDQPLETGGGIVHASPLLGDAPFLLVSADVWSDISYASLVRRSLKEMEEARLILVDNPSHHPDGDFSLSSNNALVARHTKSFTYSGIALLRARTVIHSTCRRRCFPLREVFAELIEKQQIFADYHSGAWTDVGTPERLAALASLLATSKK